DVCSSDLQLVPDHVLRRPRRPGTKRARGIRGQGERKVPRGGQGGDDGAHRAAAGGKAAPDVGVALIDPAAHIGAVHLTIGDLNRSIRFYEAHLGFTLHRRDERTAWMGAGGPDLLVLTQCEQAPRVRGTTGLYHFAILVPSR